MIRVSDPVLARPNSREIGAEMTAWPTYRAGAVDPAQLAAETLLGDDLAQMIAALYGLRPATGSVTFPKDRAEDLLKLFPKGPDETYERDKKAFLASYVSATVHADGTFEMKMKVPVDIHTHGGHKVTIGRSVKGDAQQTRLEFSEGFAADGYDVMAMYHGTKDGVSGVWIKVDLPWPLPTTERFFPRTPPSA